eukprot:COSAG01_NODE_72987_length_251_cov_1.019737_1_plen_38_part_10
MAPYAIPVCIFFVALESGGGVPAGHGSEGEGHHVPQPI